MKYLSVFTLAALLTIWAGFACAGGYHHHTINNYDIDNITNFTGVSHKDLVTIGALAGSAAGHQFMRATNDLQWSVAGACVDSDADDCGLSGALSRRVGDVLFTGMVSGASDERMLILSVGGTF